MYVRQWQFQGGGLGRLPPKRLWRPFAINARFFGAYGSRNRDKKYSKMNNFFLFVKRQDLLSGLYPTSYRIA